MTGHAGNVVPMPVRGQTDVDLAQAIRKALDENRARWAEAMDARRFLDPCWEFVRLLKRLEAFAELTGYEAAKLIERTYPSVWDELPPETSLGEPVLPWPCVVDAWETVEVPEGASSALRLKIERAVERASKTPPKPERYGRQFAHPTSGTQRTFLRTVELLQEKAGSQPVPIPQQVMADVLGCHQTEVSRWVRAARRAELLKPETPHNRRKRRCAEYRFVPYPDPEIE